MSGLAAKIVALHKSLERASLPHALGGALALAWCTQRARGTIDIDLNIFVSPQHSATVFKCLPAGVKRGVRDLEIIQREGQVRLWWEQTPIDLFLNTPRFHDGAAQRTRWETFSNRQPQMTASNG